MQSEAIQMHVADRFGGFCVDQRGPVERAVANKEDPAQQGRPLTPDPAPGLLMQLFTQDLSERGNGERLFLG